MGKEREERSSESEDRKKELWELYFFGTVPSETD